MNLIIKKFNELIPEELYEILKSRSEIFILEQNINYQDLDNIDYNSYHFFIKKDKRVIAYLRAFYIDDKKEILKIGRVLTLKHGLGLGKKLLQESISEIKKKNMCKKIYIHAQKYATGFYEKFGFNIISDEFIEEGIIHVEMELNI